MRKKIFIILLLIFAIGAGVIVFYVQKHAGKAGVEKAIYYCPMHPTYISDRPGDCPICNMKLVKKEEKVADVGKTTINASNKKTLEEVCIDHECTMKECAMHVKVGLKPGERIKCPICGEVMGTDTGKVVEIIQYTEKSAGGKKERKLLFYRNPMNPQATSPVPMKDSMGMDYVPVYEEEGEKPAGQTVTISTEKQQLIGVKTEAVEKRRLEKVIRASGKIAYDPELVVSQQEFVQALINEENVEKLSSQDPDIIKRAKALTGAARTKLKLRGMSEEQISELEKTKKSDTSLYLPEKGENVWAYISIYEYEIGPLKKGDSVDVEAVAYPGESFKGKVVAINPVLDPVTRTNQVRVAVENVDNKLKPEMYVNAKIRIDMGEKLALPELAVMDTGIRKIVYLSREGGLLEAREVKLGQKAEGYYEIISGLSEGNIVVTSGNFFIDSESKLKSALDGTGHQHGQ